MEPAELEQLEAEAKERAKREFREALVSAEEDLVTANLKEEDLKAELKAAKSHRQDCLDRLRRIKMRGVDGFYVAPKVGAEEGDDSWRLIPMADLLSSVEGLGAKKLESLIELYPTLGHIEDARGEASRDFQPFDSVLPKGIGSEMAGKIENLIIDAIASHQVVEPEKEQEKQHFAAPE